MASLEEALNHHLSSRPSKAAFSCDMYKCSFRSCTVQQVHCRCTATDTSSCGRCTVRRGGMRAQSDAWGSAQLPWNKCKETGTSASARTHTNTPGGTWSACGRREAPHPPWSSGALTAHWHHTRRIHARPLRAGKEKRGRE